MQMWDERYSKDEYVFGKEPNTFLVSAASQIPKGRVLCIGEGEGRNAVYLASLGYEVVAVDQSASGMAKAARLAAERGVQLQTMVRDLAHWQIDPNAWQGIVSIFCHLPAALRQQVHRNVVTGLATNGVFVLEAYTPRQLAFQTGGPRDPNMLPTPALLQDELAGLDFAVLQEMERSVVEGLYHTGMAAVVQVVARKPGRTI